MVGGSVTRLGCLLALVLAALSAPASVLAGGHTAAPHDGRHGVQVKGQRSQRISPFSASTTSSAANIPGHLMNHGGPVMSSNTVHAIYWFPSGYSLDSSWRGVVDGYLGNVATDSGKTSNVFGVTPQYGVQYNAHFAGSAVDTAPFPASGCSQGVGGKPCLTEEQIFDELSAFAHTQGWSGDPNAVTGSNPSPSSHPTHLFVVYLPPGVADCFDASSGTCSANSSAPYYCAYHTAWYDNSQTYVWANMPWSWSDSGCQGPTFPNGATADSAVDTTSHEYIEALTDPYLNAWYDAQGYEIADKCQTTYGSPLVDLGNYNQLVNGGHYWTELEYSNKLSDCYQLGEPVVSSFAPTVAFTGQTVQIGGQNFFGPVVVKFNGIVAQVVSVTPTLLTVKVPSGSFAGKVTVQAIGGLGTSTASFGVPKPVISAIGPLDGRIGTTVTVTGSNFTAATAVKFGTFTDSGFVIDDDGTITAHVPTGFSTGKISVTSLGGTATSAQTFQVTKVTGITPLAAKAGAVVTITGQGLGSADTVDFPNHPGVAVNKAGPSSLQVTVPNDATGPAPLVVHTPNIDGAGLATKPFKATPTISSFTPDGQAGSAVTISGANLGDATAVKFGTVAATFDAPSATSITAYTPNGFSSGPITVVTPRGSVLTPTAFAVTKVAAFTPASGAGGSVVTITGQGLKSTTTVDFGGSTGIAVLATTRTSVTVRVPLDAVIGQLVVHTPNIDGAGIAAAKTFKPLPRVTGFDSSGYQVGSTVTVTGTNLAEAGAYTAKLGTHAVDNLQVVDAHTATFVVPGGAVSSVLTFANAAGTTTSAGKVTIRPTIAGFAPAEAATGSKITLSGATFTGTTAVSFGGAKTTAFTVAAGGATLTVTVPGGAVDGPVTVTNAGGATSSAGAFHVLPVVTSFSPASGAVGTTLTVTGTGLKSVTSVDFGGGVSATPASTTATSLKVVVPAGATSGPIAVHSGASVGAARAPFGVTFSVTSFGQPFAAPGATITINGVGLSNITAVQFGALNATISAQSGSTLRVVVPAIAGDTTVSVTKGATTIQAPSQFGLFAVTSTAPNAVTAGGTITVSGSHLAGATAAFAGVGTPVALTNGSATVPDGFTGGTVTIADAYGDSIAETVALFAIASYSTSHAGPGDTLTINLTAGDYSSSTVHVRFPGAGQVDATGGDGSVQVAVPAGATSGMLEVEAGASGWATGSAFTVDRASVVLNEVEPTPDGAQIELLATGGGGLGDTTITWKANGNTHTLALAAQTVQAGDLVVVQTTIGSGDVTIEVGTPLGAEDGLALGTAPDTAWLVGDGVWGSTGAVDWSGLTAGQSVARSGTAAPDDVANWSTGDATMGNPN